MISVKLSAIFCLIAAACAAPQYPAHTNFGRQPQYQQYQQRQQPFVPIVSQDFQIAPDGKSYQFSYVSGDGSQRQESGAEKGPDNFAVSGQFSYNLPNGGPVQVSYVSDEFGYQPSGPGVHPDIIKAVAEQVAEARSSPQSYNSGAYNSGSYNSGSSFGSFHSGGSSFGAARRPVYG